MREFKVERIILQFVYLGNKILLEIGIDGLSNPIPDNKFLGAARICKLLS